MTEDLLFFSQEKRGPDDRQEALEEALKLYLLRQDLAQITPWPRWSF